MEISQTYFEKYRYSIHSPIGVLYISEPIGWNEDNKTFKRSKEVHGVFASLSNNLEFYKGDENNNGGYEYLRKIYKEYSINTTVYLLKEENISGNWIESYKGFFDFSTYSQNTDTISIKFNESGLYEKIKSRNSEELEINRMTTMEGSILKPLDNEVVNLKGRNIILVSELNLTSYNEPLIVTVPNVGVELKIDKKETIISMSLSIPLLENGCLIPLKVTNEVSGNVQTVSDYFLGMNRSSGSGYTSASSTSNMFYDESVNKKTLKLSLEFEFSISYSTLTMFDSYVDLIKYGGNLGLEYISHKRLITVNYNQDSFLKVYSYKNKLLLEPLLEGESLALAVRVRKQSFGGSVKLNFTKVNLIVQDETYAESSLANFVLPFETLNRIIHIITDKQNKLKSKALGRVDTIIPYDEDGYASLTGITNGLWVRQFKDSKITTSFQDFIDSFSAIWQLGYGIEKVGFEENIRVEHISHFYRDDVTIKLGKVNNILRKCAKEYFYSSLNIGYSQPSGTNLYEESNGLDEYNISNNYTTPIFKIENKFSNISKYRADSYGIEFARRKPFYKYPEEDTRYDNTVMALDLKRGNYGVFEQRKWKDDFVVPSVFDKENTGVYSPETATNLRFSPANILLRVGYWIKGGLVKDSEKYIRYSSSNGNSKLKTLSKTPGSVEVSENGDFLCGDLNKNLFNPEIITFEKGVDTFLMKEVTGSVIINGDAIMNYYGLVEFINEEDYYEYGYLISLEPNNEGKWELLSSSKAISKAANECELDEDIDYLNNYLNKTI